ncbi:hypothetical protein [Streptacidiphilus monticola]|uniref:Uncharacterized protein n=1 Tax=Streptacidiphilus monticola TaxID=2161674 RepID=A0ABW1G8M7_9ACTN
MNLPVTVAGPVCGVMVSAVGEEEAIGPLLPTGIAVVLGFRSVVLADAVGVAVAEEEGDVELLAVGEAELDGQVS